MTVFLEASLPAAGMVSTTAMGSTSGLGRLVTNSSHTSSSMHAPLAIALAESMTLPPPTARTQSMPSSLHSATPSRTRSISGLGRTPPSSTCSTPAASNDAFTRSMSPLFTALEPPKCSSTRFAPRSASLAPTFSSAPRPNTKWVGETNSKFSMVRILPDRPIRFDFSKYSGTAAFPHALRRKRAFRFTSREAVESGPTCRPLPCSTVSHGAS